MKTRRRLIKPQKPSIAQIMLDIYYDIDSKTKNELKRLKKEEGIIKTCRNKCYHCCGQQIKTFYPEAHVASNYIKRNFSANELEKLRAKIEQYVQHLRGDFENLIVQDVEAQDDFSECSPHCLLLKDESCSIYPVRPIICRTHYVSSSPKSCRSRNGSQLIKSEPKQISSVLDNARPFVLKIKNIAKVPPGIKNLYGAIQLLPRWLTLELGWEDLWKDLGQTQSFNFGGKNSCLINKIARPIATESSSVNKAPKV